MSHSQTREHLTRANKVVWGEATATAATTLTPPQLAARWGVSPDKVLALIHSGQLMAINLATNPRGRPRYRLRLSEIERFEEARSTKPPPPKRRRRRREAETAGKNYF
jgi:hypothetical protein